MLLSPGRRLVAPARAVLRPCAPLVLAHAPSLRALSPLLRSNRLAAISPRIRCVATNADVAPEASGVDMKADPTRQGYFFLDSVFPIPFGWWDPRPYLARMEKNEVLERIRNSVPKDVKHGFTVDEVEARMKDGGAFIHFRYHPDPGATPSDALRDIESSVKRAIGNSSLSTFSSMYLNKPHLHLVRGRPWKEDMNRYPSWRLRLTFSPSSKIPAEEVLYTNFRPFGRIRDIEVPKGEDSALVSYSRLRGATAARNCMHGVRLTDDGEILAEKAAEGTRLMANYEKPVKVRNIGSWLSAHTRWVLPALAFVIGGITYFVFDPIRAFFVESKVTGAFNVERYRLWTWLRRNTVSLFFASKEEATRNGWMQGKDEENLMTWLNEQPVTFITVTGPRGSGKSQLVERVVARSPKTLVIDCDAIARMAKNDSSLVAAVAQQTGYWPIFSWVSSLNNLLDIAAVGIIGSKAGFSTSVDEQLKQVLGVTTAAFVNINEKTKWQKEKAAKAARKHHKDNTSQAHSVASKASSATAAPGAASISAEQTNGRLDYVAGTGLISELGKGVESKMSMGGPSSRASAAAVAATAGASLEDGDKEATSEDGDVNAAVAEERVDVPIVIIKSFHHKGVKKDELWSTMSEWAAELVDNQIAHVIFVSDNPVDTSKALAKALPNKPWETIALADASADSASSFIASRLQEMGKLDEKDAEPVDESDDGSRRWRLSPALQEWVDKLGGRKVDMETLLQKVSTGQTIPTAVEDIISRTVVELRKNAFGDDADDAKSLPWAREQAWLVVKSLAARDEVNYYGFLMDQLKGDESVLKALEQAEIISVKHINGRPATFAAGRPVYRSAFRRLVKDTAFNRTQTFFLNAAAIASMEKTMEACERELHTLSNINGGLSTYFSSGVPHGRVRYLLAKLKDAQAKLEAAEKENLMIKASLAEVV